MGRKNLWVVVVVFFVILSISGCGTVPKKFKEEVSGIKTKVDTLETRVEGVETKQAEVERATSEQAQALEEMKARRTAHETTNISVKPRGTAKSKERTRQVQTCLKNAGFYNGKIDGVKGKNTTKAIKEFQKANGLKADGVVGKKTWELLSKYESGQATAPTAEPTQEGATK